MHAVLRQLVTLQIEMSPTETSDFLKQVIVLTSFNAQGLIVQRIVSFTSSLRGQLVKGFTTSLPNTLIFFVEKMREAVQKLLTFFQHKILAYIRY